MTTSSMEDAQSPAERFARELRALIGAPYPLLSIVTHEEERAVEAIRDTVSALGHTLALWDPGDTTEPADALRAVVAADPPAADVVVVLDSAALLGDSAVQRTVRRACGPMMASGRTLVFVSPRAITPEGLEREHVTLRFPLPGRDALETVLLRIAPWIPDAVDTETVSRAALGLTARQAERAFARVAEAAKQSPLDTAGWTEAVSREKRWLVAEGGAVEVHDEPGDLDQLGGLEALKQWAEERSRAFSDEARAFGLPAPRGLLLLGVQGCGKSSAAKAVAGTWSLPLLRLDLGAVFSGDAPPEPTLRRAMSAAEAMAPCVLWADEIEKGFAAGDPTTVRLLGTVLTWLQERHAPVFFVATANDVESLPPELLRRGRLDEVFFVDLPDVEARRDILAIHLRARGREPASFDLMTVAQTTKNYSGAELEQIVVAALHSAFARGRDLEQPDLEGAARTMVPLYALREAEIKALRAWAKDRARPAGIDRSLVDLFRR